MSNALANVSDASTKFVAKTFINSQRWQDLDRRQQYYLCTQHDFKRFDFDGRVISSAGGISATQPLLAAEKYSGYIPLRSRRPSTPYRLPRVMVKAFTNLVFGMGRFPDFLVSGDSDTQDFVQTLSKEMSLPVKMMRARNIGGSCGTTGLSWCFRHGKPRVQVHNGRNLYVHEWEDREMLIPKHVTEMYQYPVDEWDPAKKKYMRNMYWYRRDWTPDVDAVFMPMRVDQKDGQTEFQPDPDKSNIHNDGLIHFEWIQNTESDDDSEDGMPDYEGLYESFDTLDLLLSVITRGAVLNLDPTLMLKLDPDLVQRFGVKKGSDNALNVGLDGDAKYLELGGQSITAGVSLFNAKRRSILEVAQCVIPDPDQISANGQSSVAMKMLYAPMLAAADERRERYGVPMCRMLKNMADVARAGMNVVSVTDNTSGEEKDMQGSLALPPRVTHEPVLDEDGVKTGEENVTKEDRHPGEGGDVEPQWPPYFPPTPADQTATITMLSTAVGQKPVLSTQTAAELAAAALGKSPDEEAKRMQNDKDEDSAQQAQQFAGMPGGPGGQVGGKNQLPPGAKPKPGKPGAPGGKPGKPGKGGADDAMNFGSNKPDPGSDKA